MGVSGVWKRSSYRAALLALACAAAACRSASTSVTAPTGTKCAVAVTNNTPELPATGGSGTITLTAARECPWTASAEASWITVGATSGQGPATLTYAVQPNPIGTAREGRITVAQQPIDVAQAAAPCRYDVSAASVSVDASEQQVSIALTATDGCQWTVRTDSSWIGSAAPASGAGSATIRVAIAANAGVARTGTLAIGGATVRILQAAPTAPAPMPTPTAPTPTPPAPPPPSPSPQPAPAPSPTPTPTCTTAIKPTWYDAGRGPDDIQIAVTADPGCTWTAASTVPWVTVAQGASGSGDGTVELLVQANSGPARSVTLTIAGQPFALQQEGSQ